MKVAYIVPSLQATGPIIVVNNLVRYLKDIVEKVDVYYFDELPAMQFDCRTIQIRMGEKIDFDAYDIIHSHCLRPDKYLVKWKKYIHKAKIVTTIHQDTFQSLKFQYNCLLAYGVTEYWNRLQKKFDGIISISNQLRDIYNSKVGNKIQTIYNGTYIHIDDSKMNVDVVGKIQQYRHSGFKILGTYALIVKRKGINQILDALPFLSEYAMIIIGSGPYVSELKQQVERLHLENRVCFIPHLDEPYNYLSLFDVYTMTSYSEGFGLAMVEAAMAGKSIVCSDLLSFHEIFTDREVSFFELDNTKSLINAVENAYIHKEEKGHLACLKATLNYTARNMAKNHLLYYQKLI